MMSETPRYEAHPTESEHTERSLGLMLKAQYLSKEFNDVFASTELREHEIIGLSGIFSTRFVTQIMSTTKEDLEISKDELEKQIIQERLAIKRRIQHDPNAMAFVIQDSYLYAFGLARQSLKRQSRTEAVTVSTASVARNVSREEIGLGSSIAAKLGLSRRYGVAYEEKK